MEILILCGTYLLEFFSFQLGLQILFEMHLKSKAWVILGIILSVIIVILPVSAAWKNVLVTVSVIVVMFISVEGTVVEKGVRFVLTLLLLICIDDMFVRFCEQGLSIFNNNYIENITYLTTKCCTAISIVLLKFIKEKITHKNVHISSAIYFIIGIIAILMAVCLNTLDQVTRYLSNSMFRIFCNVMNIVIYISIFLLVVFIIYIKKTHERMEQLLKTEKLLKESQVNYYKQSLKKEEDTRKYRHDMVNHLTYVRDILNQDKVDDAEKYLTNILGGFKKIQNTYYVTGNEMVDTIMNYFFGMLPKNVKIEIRGRCPIEIDIEETDTCTIFSNIFQNAIDEILENEIENPTIIIEIQKGKQYAEYKIKNSLHAKIDEKYINKNGLPKSHKSDKHNHGIGMTNIKHTVERNHGKFEWHQEDNYFCTSIILPIK